MQPYETMAIFGLALTISCSRGLPSLHCSIVVGFFIIIVAMRNDVVHRLAHKSVRLRP
jgi:hypothetical protein